MEKNLKALGIATAVAFFAAPGILLGYTLLGGSLGVGTSGNGYQRDVRVRNNAADAAANNNATPEANHPGALGAPLAVWKASEAWNSNNSLAAKNFDFDWQGASSTSSANQNVVFWANCGTNPPLAFTETPISDGWRIQMCEEFIWSDGPGSPSGSQVDIQGVVVHELGHALGLSHSQSANCSGSCSVNSSMCAFICSNGVSERTIQPDDAAGLQAIYAAIPANKPVITGLSGSFSAGGTLTIHGSNFDSTVRVKFTAGTTQNTGTIPGVVSSVPSLNGGTQINVTIPATALDGNVLVWSPSISRLSNPFPIDINAVPPSPPSIASVSPPSVQAYQGGTITLSGSGFTGATQIDSGGILLSAFEFTVIDDNAIVYDAPTPLALGATSVTVTTPNGTSNAGNFQYVETSPPKLTNPAATFTGQTFIWDFGGPANHNWVLILGVGDNTTVPFNGYDVLANYLFVTAGPLGPIGVSSFSTTVPPGNGGVVFYSQILTIDLNNNADIRASNIPTTTILL